MDSSPGLSALLQTPEPSIFNIAIKEEPVEILDSPDECSVTEDPRNESQFIVPSQSSTIGNFGCLTNNKTPRIPAKTSRVAKNVPTKSINSPVSADQAPITKKIIINGQAKTCTVVAIPELKQNMTKKVKTLINSDPKFSVPASTTNKVNQDPNRLVKCARCLNMVFLNDFRRHIDICLPTRKVTSKSKPKEKKTKPDFDVTKQSREAQGEQRETVQVMYNPFTGEVVRNKMKIKLNNLVSNSSNLSVQTAGPSENIIMPRLKETDLSKNSVKVNKETYKVKIPDSFHGFYATYDKTDINKTKIQLTLNCHECKFKTHFILEMKNHIKKQHPDGNSLLKNTPNPKGASKEILRKGFSVTARKDACDSPAVVSSSDMSQDKSTTLPISAREEGSDKSLASSASSDSLPGFRGFDQIASQGYLSSKLCNLNDILRSHLKSVPDPPKTAPPPSAKITEDTGVNNTTTDECTSELLVINQSDKSDADEDTTPAQETQSTPPSEDVLVSPRKTRSKSVCGRIVHDKETNEEPRRSMRLRSKSVCARKAESEALEWSPRRTRSRSVCKDRFVAEQATRDFKRAQSVPRGPAMSETTSRGRARSPASVRTSSRGRSRGPASSETTSRGRAMDKKGNISKQTKDGNAEQKATFRSRSKSVAAPKNDTMHPITYYQTLLKTRSKSVDRSKFLSDLNSLKNNGDLAKSSSSVADFGRETNRVSSPEGSILGISKSKSVMSDISRLNDFNDSMEVESENSYDDLFLLADSTFSCTICSYTCDKERVLKEHERHHRKTNYPIFRCVYCNQRYTKYMLYSHVQNVHPGQKFQICENEPNGVQPSQTSKVNEDARKSRANTPSLKKAEENDKRMSLDCSRCSFSTTRLDKMTQHLNKHDLEDTETVKPAKNPQPAHPVAIESLKCTLCSFQTAAQEELKSHLQDHDFVPIIGTPGVSKLHITCQYCSYATDELQKLRAHFNTHKDNMAIKQCPHCDFRSTGKALAGHRPRCDVSPTKTTENKQYVVNEGNDSIAKFECRSCSYKNSVLPKMKKHVALHRRNEEILECSRCDFRSTKNALIYHMTICKGEETAESDKLETREKEISVEGISVQLIQLNNSGVLKYACSMCSYKCRQICDMKKHTKLHENGAAISKCNFCEFRSTRMAVCFHRRLCKKRAKDQDRDGQKKQKGLLTLKVKPKSIFRCVHCKYCTTLRIKLNLHVKKHHPNRKEVGKVNVKAHSCSRCSFTTNSQKKMKLHSSIKCEKNFKCSLCSFTSSNKFNLAQHMSCHKQNIPVRKCPFCDFASFPHLLRKHRLKYHHTVPNSDTLKEQDLNREKIEQNKVHWCPRCDFSGDTREELLRHSMECSANLKCRLCSYSNASQSFFRVHMVSHKKKLPIKKCPCCDFASVHSILAKHQRLFGHTILKPDIGKKQPVRRKTIDEKNDNSASLKEHREEKRTNSQKKSKLHSRVANFKCTLCSFSSTQEMYLKQHMKGHENNVPNEKCPLCDFESTKTMLLKHARKHIQTAGSGNRKIKEKKTLFQCVQCSFSTPLRIKLKIHTQKSHQFKGKHFTLFDNKYQCNHCSYSSTLKGNILRHIDSHKSLKWIVKQCRYCEYKSTQNALKVHYRTCRAKKEAKLQSSKGGVKNGEVISQSELLVVPSRPRFTCTQCSYSAARKYYLERHKKVHKARNLVLEQCAYCTFRSTPKIVKNHFYSCTGRGNLDPLDTDPPTLEREEEDFSVIESDPLSFASSERPFPPILERMPPVLERADLILNEETATSGLETSPPVLERVTTERAVERTASKDSALNVIPEPVLKNFKCQYCSFESVLGYLLERHMLLHEVLKLPVSQCDNCDFRSTPGTLSAHQRACSGNSRERSDSEKNQAKNISRASRRKSTCSEIGSSSANKRKLDKNDDIWDNKSLGRTPSRKSRRLEEKFYANNSLKELFVDVVSCAPLERSRSRSRIRRKENPVSTANKIIEDCSTYSSKVSLFEEDCFKAKKSKTDLERSRSRIRTKDNPDSTVEKVNEHHGTDSSIVSLIEEDCSEAKKSKTDLERSRSRIRTEDNPDSTVEKVNEDHGTDSSIVSLIEEDCSEAKKSNTDSTQSISDVSVLDQSRRRIKTKDNSDSNADKVNGNPVADSRNVSPLEGLLLEGSEVKKSKTDSTLNIPEVSTNVESNGIRKKAFSCPKCNYSSSLRVKLRFHLKRCH